MRVIWQSNQIIEKTNTANILFRTKPGRGLDVGKIFIICRLGKFGQDMLRISLFKHIPQISDGLHLSPTAVPYTWRYAASKIKKGEGALEIGEIDRGAQIDLLFDREDDAITICEVKYTQSSFSIDKRYAEQLSQKLNVFKTVTKSKKQLFL